MLSEANGIYFVIFFVKVKLALQMKHLGVVGIDLSGNPVIGEWYFSSLHNFSPL